MELEYLEDLIDFAVSAEEGFLLSQLGKDAADGPDVNSKAVLLLPEQNFGGPVPKGFNSWVRVLMGREKARASPKSAILRVPERSMRRF